MTKNLRISAIIMAIIFITGILPGYCAAAEENVFGDSVESKYIFVDHDGDPSDFENIFYIVTDGYGNEVMQFTGNSVINSDVYIECDMYDDSYNMMWTVTPYVINDRGTDALSVEFIPSGTNRITLSVDNAESFKTGVFYSSSIGERNLEQFKKLDIKYEVRDGNGNLVKTLRSIDIAEGTAFIKMYTSDAGLWSINPVGVPYESIYFNAARILGQNIWITPVIRESMTDKVKKGDVNFDGIIDVDDILQMQAFLVNKTGYFEIQFISSDMNDDDHVNVFDLILLKRLILSGQANVPEPTEPVVTTVTTTVSETKPVTTSTTTIATTTSTNALTTTMTTVRTTASTTTKATTTVTAAKTTVKTTTKATTKATTKTTVKTTITTKATTKVTTQVTFVNKSSYRGIDVSRWQGDIDWKKVKADGIDFAIIRAGYGCSATQKDANFDKNVKGAQAAGIDCGAYWYSYAVSADEAIEEANACYQVIKGCRFSYPIMFDIEDSSQMSLSNATLNKIINNFCSTLEAKGYFVSIYSYASFLNTRVSEENLLKYDVWVAHYNVDKPSFDGSYGMWQYSSTGSVNGINGNVDLDIAYKNYPYIMYTYKKNGY